jgi:hypothetical protein
MSPDLGNYDMKTQEAVKAFWGNRIAAHKAQLEAGKLDRGQRGAVTAGKNMDGFINLVREVVLRNGLSDRDIFVGKSTPTLPGYFRPTKCWDLVVVRNNRLVAAIEFKSHVGSFSNNFNNRIEEALGSATDLWTAFHKNAFGDSIRPFVGWLLVLEDNELVHRPIRERAQTFSIFPEFRSTTYAQRYADFCRKLVLERLYTATALILTPANAVASGAYSEPSELSSIKGFLTSLASHIAVEAIRRE